MKDISFPQPGSHGQENDTEISIGRNDVAQEKNSKGKEYLRGMLNKLMKIKLSDGRILVGVFLCTDRDSNVILGSCSEYVLDQGGKETQTDEENTNENIKNENNDNDIDPTLNIEPRILGLAMVPGKHIVSIHLDEMPSYYQGTSYSRGTSKVPENSPLAERRENKSFQEDDLNVNLTDENIDIDLEVATQKIESMYT